MRQRVGAGGDQHHAVVDVDAPSDDVESGAGDGAGESKDKKDRRHHRGAVYFSRSLLTARLLTLVGVAADGVVAATGGDEGETGARAQAEVEAEAEADGGRRNSDGGGGTRLSGGGGGVRRVDGALHDFGGFGALPALVAGRARHRPRSRAELRRELSLYAVLLTCFAVFYLCYGNGGGGGNLARLKGRVFGLDLTAGWGAKMKMNLRGEQLVEGEGAEEWRGGTDMEGDEVVDVDQATGAGAGASGAGSTSPGISGSHHGADGIGWGDGGAGGGAGAGAGAEGTTGVEAAAQEAHSSSEDGGGGGGGGQRGKTTKTTASGAEVSVAGSASNGARRGAGGNSQNSQQKPLHLHGISAAAAAAAGAMYAPWMTPAQKAEQRAKVRAAERRREREMERRAGVRAVSFSFFFFFQTRIRHLR